MPFDQPLEPQEVLSRFIFSSKDFSAPQNRVKHGAFLPSKEPLETSVSRTVGLGLAEVQAIGTLVGESRATALKAWGDVVVEDVLAIGLGVRPDAIPERHAAIIGWPELKDEQISLAQELAAAATLRLPA